ILLTDPRELGKDVGKVPFEENLNIPRSLQFFKAVLSAIGKKERAREASAFIWKSDQHVSAARPDMERIFLKLKAPSRPRRKMELFVTVIQISLAALIVRKSRHRRADGGC